MPPSASDTCAAIITFRPEVCMLRRVIASVCGQVGQILIFDNATTDPTLDAYLSEIETEAVTVIRSPTNIGLAAAMNRASEHARTKGFTHLLLLDQDSEPTPTMILALTERMRLLQSEGRRVAAVAPLLLPPINETYLSIRYSWRRPTRNDDLVPADFVPSSGSLVPPN